MANPPFWISSQKRLRIPNSASPLTIFWHPLIDLPCGWPWGREKRFPARVLSISISGHTPKSTGGQEAGSGLAADIFARFAKNKRFVREIGMGIHGLSKVIGDHAPSGSKENEIKNYFGEWNLSLRFRYRVSGKNCELLK